MSNDFPDRQAPSPQGWDKIHDIRWFAENLNGAQFKALSTGLGLGGLRPAGTKVQRAVLPTTGPVFHMPNPVTPSAATAVSAPRAKVQVPKVWWGGFSKKKEPAKMQQSLQAQRFDRDPSVTQSEQHSGSERLRLQALQVSGRPTYARLLSAWAFDFLVVAVSLAVAFAVAVALSMVKTGETDNWLALRPIKFLVARKPIEILAGVYAIFALYMIVFKFGAGKTIGEVVFLRKKPKTA